jgi:hypothetical protein
VGSSDGPKPSSDIGQLFLRLAGEGQPVGAYRAAKSDDIWAAVRNFFGREQEVA